MFIQEDGTAAAGCWVIRPPSRPAGPPAPAWWDPAAPVPGARRGRVIFFGSLYQQGHAITALLHFQAASKYNSQYHKLFKDIPTEESVLKGGWHSEGRAWGWQELGHGLPCPPSLLCSLLLRAPERHPHPGKALHLPQLALLLRKPFREGHQGNGAGGSSPWSCRARTQIPPKSPSEAST